jgi:hypothetical protein
MSDYDDDVLDLDVEPSGSDLVKQLRKQVNELSKALKDRDSQLEELLVQSREQDIAEVLVEMGVNPKVASFVPDSVEDVDDLEAWLAEYGDVFGVGLVGDKESALDSESVRAAELMSAVEEGGIDPELGQDLAARIAAASTPEELQALLRG